MTNLHIQYFLEVANLKSFTKAAEKLYVAQPSISRQISNLENELKVTLFDRTKNTNQIHHGTIHIGLPAYFSNSTLWRNMYRTFSRDYPNIQLMLHILPIQQTLQKLNNDELDIVLCYDYYLKDNADYAMYPALSVPGYLLFHNSNPLFLKKNLTLHDFEEQTLYTLTKNSDTFAQKSMLAFCEKENFVPQKICEFDNIETLLFSLSLGDGYTFFADNILYVNDLSFQKLPINHVDNLSLFWKKGNKNSILNVFANEFLFLITNNNESN